LLLQRRIAEVLDKAEALRAKRRAALAQLDSLTKSLFLDLFGDPATNPKGWPTKPLGEIGKVITGNTPPRSNPNYYGKHIEWIKSDNINTPHYYLTKATEGLSESGKSIARTVPAGSILITCIAGSPECIGNASMTDREVAFNQQINAFIPDKEDAHFIYAQMIVGKRLIQEASTAGMKGMVSKGRFEQILFPLPPISLQREFARRVTAVEKLKTAQRAALAELDALFASLQHRAFRGEL
jgi:type I restriction enzyme S subunit